MNDPKTSPSPTSPSSNVRRPFKRSPRSTTFKTRPTPTSSTLKATIPEDNTTSNQDMAASFLQFCAMCEKQILTPNNSILYCSEACRRKDSCKPLALAVAAMSPTTTPPSSAISCSRPIFPPRIATDSMFGSTSPMGIPTGLHNTKSDHEPTRWKPKLHPRSQSDAFRYLSQFQRSSSSVERDAHDEQTPIRTLFSPSSTTSIASMATPSLSLSHSPTTSSCGSSSDEDELNTDPFESRHDPMYSLSTATAKGIELVMPFVAPSIAISLPHQTEDHQYEKMSMTRMSLQLVKTGCMDWSQRI